MSESNGAATKARKPVNRIADSAAVVTPVVEKKIAIVGKAPSSRMQAPYQDPSWEIWGLADLAFQIPRWDRWFEIHEIEPRKQRWGAYWDWLKGQCSQPGGKPVYVQRPHAELPHAISYPLDEMTARFGRYFTNTVSYMIAYAIAEKATHISVFGVDMAQHGDGVKSEYAHQRPSCEYFLGVARGAGIEVHVHEHSDLLKTNKLYGFETGDHAMQVKWKTRLSELEQQIQEQEKVVNNATLRIHVLKGAVDDMHYWRQWLPQ